MNRREGSTEGSRGSHRADCAQGEARTRVAGGAGDADRRVAVELIGLSLGFREGRGVRWVVRDVDAVIEQGTLVLLSGPSGAGKSTLLDLLAGQIDPFDARRVVRGRCRLTAGKGRARAVALFQQDGLWDDLSVVENVRVAANGSREEAEHLLARVGLRDLPSRVAQLSGGQRKRVALARALALRPDLLLLDEPTSGLDPQATLQVMDSLEALARETAGRPTIVLVSHDLPAARALASTELVLPGDGRLVRLERPGATAPEPGPVLFERQGLRAHLARPCLAAAGLSASVVQVLSALVPDAPLRCLAAAIRQTLSLTPFLALVGFILGAITLHFVMRNDPLHGAQATLLLGGTGKVLLAVLLPLLGGLLYAAPAVSGVLVRAGTMARDRQLAAYRALGRSVRRELLSPILYAHLIALPLAVGAMLVAAVYGSWMADSWSRATSFESFLPPYLESVVGADLAWGMVKSLGAAFFVTWIPWHLAARRGLSPADLASASRRAWFRAALLIVGWNGAVLFPQLG